jgi:SlyX protein
LGLAGQIVSNGGMNDDAPPTAQELAQRLTDLEIKVGFTDDLVDHLNTLVARQQHVIERLMQELARLSDQLADQGQGAGFRSLRDELPPHY